MHYKLMHMQAGALQWLQEMAWLYIVCAIFKLCDTQTFSSHHSFPPLPIPFPSPSHHLNLQECSAGWAGRQAGRSG